MKTKRVEWSYPSSTNANRFGFGRSGCYTVEIVYYPVVDPPIALAGFETLDKAHNYAESLGCSWDRLTK